MIEMLQLHNQEYSCSQKQKIFWITKEVLKLIEQYFQQTRI